MPRRIPAERRRSFEESNPTDTCPAASDNETQATGGAIRKALRTIRQRRGASPVSGSKGARQARKLYQEPEDPPTDEDDLVPDENEADGALDDQLASDTTHRPDSPTKTAAPDLAKSSEGVNSPTPERAAEAEVDPELPSISDEEEEWDSDFDGDAETGMTSHPAVLRSIIAGTLARDAKTKPEIARVLSSMRVQTQNNKMPQPAHYINLLVDSRGHSPTPNQLLAALDVMKHDYIGSRSNHMAHKIDSFRRPIPKDATPRTQYWKRKYLSNGGTRSQNRNRQFAKFDDRLRRRLVAIPQHLRDKPLQHPLTELGYTHKTDARLKVHQRHSSSTFLMNLMEAVLGLLFPGEFAIAQYVIFLCSRTEQGAIGELFFSLLSQAYTSTGGGFNYFPAGRSVRSVYSITENDWDRFWKWQEHNIDMTGNATRDIALQEAAHFHDHGPPDAVTDSSLAMFELQGLGVHVTDYSAVALDSLHEREKARCSTEIAAEEAQIEDVRKVLREWQGGQDMIMRWRDRLVADSSEGQDFLTEAQGEAAL
ncbi:hypothetical protein Slin14017_G086040 [Septoria linicola]|nr:hypothetical protein Slin14017_G086040 [Septoria linicola]